MNKIKKNYLEKVYAGFLAKSIGVRLGAPVEPAFWTHESIYDVHGDITGYVKDFKNFAADDDTNGPIFFVRALEDYCKEREIVAEDVGNAWLNYASEEHGMFWWGGYGKSTEHTAYLNLLNGIKAPQSGSIQQNGDTVAEQIGGQIFIDCWGLIWPGNIEKAAEYAEKAASVSHDGNGIYGGKFVAACIAKAFDTGDMDEIIRAGLSVVPKDSEFMRVNKAVINFYNENPDDFRACFKMLERDFGYDKYKGLCHMIPNAGVVTLSLLYGQNTISRAVEIATMCGWDTDCNAGNVGTIVGVAYGLDKIEDHYRSPINDALIASSISGSLNMTDIPTYCKELAVWGYRLAGEKLPENLVEFSTIKKKDSMLSFDFELAGSTHGIRVESNRLATSYKNTVEDSNTGKRSLKVSLLDHRRSDEVNIFYKPFYRIDDFNDERYLPTFSPQVYSGQTLKTAYKIERLSIEGDILITFYIRLSHSKKIIKSKIYQVLDSEWHSIEWLVPDTDGEPIDEIGYKLESNEKGRYVGNIYIDHFKIAGKGKQLVSFKNEKEEFNCVTQMTYNRGKWTRENEKLHVLTNTDAETYTGNYYTKDVNIKAEITPHVGLSHNLSFRVKGIMMGYHVGFNGENKVAITKNDHEYEILTEKEFKWDFNKAYTFEIKAVKNNFIFKIDGKEIFNLTDDENNYFDYGMYGFSLLEPGRASFTYLEAEEI